MKVFLILLLSSTLFSCSKIEELDKRTKSMDDSTSDVKTTTKEMSDTTKDMSDTTKEMNETTKDMRDITEGMSATTLEMQETTEELLMLSRQGATSDLREKAKDVLLNPDRGMGDILTAAKKYFYAFEYQLWNGKGKDTREERISLMISAMEELYRLLNDLNKGYTAATPIEIEKAGMKTKAFYALATTMHFNNDKQKPRLSGHEDLKETSIYDIIKSALVKLKNNEELTKYEQIVVLGENYEITGNLLNARMNFITALGIKDMVTGKEGMGYMELLQAGMYDKWFLKPLRRFGSIQVNSTFEKQNIYTQEDILFKLDGAFKTKQVLQDAEYNIQLDRYLKSIILNLNHPEVGHDDGSQNQDDGEVYDLLDNITKNK